MEALPGVTEKLVPFIQSPLVMRKLLPGIAAAAVLYPFLGVNLHIVPGHLDAFYGPAALFACFAFLLGTLVSVLNDDIYKIYEGRIFWPKPVFNTFLRLQQRRVKRLVAAARDANTANRTLRYRELWHVLRRYPTDEKGDPHASHPTLLGNVLAGYEDYPLTRYGMDSVFYWTRIWLQMERAKKDEIESLWCVADGLVNLSAVGFTGSILWVLIAIGQYEFPRAALVNGAAHPFWVALVLLALGYSFYRLSVPYARANGEIFKAIFDLYRSQISSMVEIAPTETEKWRGVWAYLQYLKIQCGSCGKYYPAHSEKCPNCGFSRMRSLQHIASLNKRSSPSQFGEDQT